MAKSLTVYSDPRQFQEGQLTGPWMANRPPRSGQSSITGNAIDMLYVNGIWTSAQAHQERAQLIADKYSGRTVVGIYNPSALHDPQATLPGTLARKTAAFAERISNQHQLSTFQTVGTQSLAFARDLIGKTQMPSMMAADAVTDIVQTAGDALGVSNDAAVENIAEIIRSNPHVHLIGHSQGSEIIVSALWKVKKEDPQFEKKYSNMKVDLIGTQSVYMPKGPIYLKVVDRSDVCATPIQPLIGMLQGLRHLPSLMTRDIDSTPIHIANMGTGHASEMYIEHLEAIRTGKEKDLRTMSVAESAMGHATLDTIGWAMYDRGKDVLNFIGDKLSPIVSRIQAFAASVMPLIRPIVLRLVKTVTDTAKIAGKVAQRTVEKGKLFATTTAKWAIDKAKQAKNWAADKAHAAWNWGTDKAHAAKGWAKGKASALLPWITNPAQAAGKWMGEKLQGTRDWAKEKAGAVLPWILNPAASAGKWMGEKVGATRDWAKEKAGAVLPWILNPAAAAGKWMGEKARANQDWVKEKASKLLPWVVNPASSAGKWLGEKARPARDWAKAKATSTQNWVKSKAGPAASWAKEKAGATTEWAKKKVESVTKPISTAGQWAGEKVKSAGEWAGKKAESALQWITGASGTSGGGSSWSLGFLSSLPGAASGTASLRMAALGPSDMQNSGYGNRNEVDPALLREQVLASEGMGFAPAASVMQPMERMFGAEFGAVRLHAGPAAAQTARNLNAEAFTIGQDVFFGEGIYDPDMPQGRGLLAHELTHVKQQTGMGSDNALRFATQEGGDAMEAEAQQARRMVMATAVGNRYGLFVDDYQRDYEADEGGLVESDVERLNRISLAALERAEQTLRREGLTFPDTIDSLVVDVSLDLEMMTDEQAIRLWASAICARLRSNIRQPGMAQSQSPRRVQQSQPPVVPANPMLARSPIGLQRAELTKEAEDPKTEETLKEIEGYADLWFVSSIVEWKLEKLWNSIDDLPALIRRNPKARELFIKSVDKGAELESIKQAAPLVAEFKADVKQVALNYMMQNWVSVQQEMVRLGLAPGRESDGRAAQQRADDHIKIVQKMAAQVVQLQEMQKQLREIYVGANWVSFGRGREGEPAMRKVDARFDPDRPPELPADQDQVPYGQVKGQWDLLAQGISSVCNNNPGIYAMVREGNVADIANGSVYQAREALRSAFDNVLENITEAEDKITNDGLDHRELLPIHQQLFTNRVTGAGGKQNWSDPYRQAVGQGIVADYQDAEFWKSLGLATLGAALFVVAEVASGGLATVALVGAGGITAYQVGSSLDNYLDMAGAAKTGVSDDTAIVEQRQVDSAKLDLVMNTVGAFLDWAGPAAKLIKGARMASTVRAAASVAREEFVQGLGKLATMSADDLAKAETRQLIEQSIRELGVEEVIARSGMSQEKLASALGKESDLGKRILAFTRDKSGLQDLANLKAGTLAREEADRLILQAIDQLGSAEAVKRAGGWKKLSTLLGNDSAAGKQLIAWREGLYHDLEKFLGTENIKRTGSASKFTNDMDLSLLGADANADVLRARQYLASRAGVSPTEIEDLLYASFFSDPRRMHLYSTLSPELAGRLTTKRAAFETELIWSRRIGLAEGPMRQSLIEQAEKLGINWTRFRELSVKDLQLLKRDVDELYKAMEAATEIGEKTRLIDSIAEKQALINATEGGGYFSGGGVQRWVSERDKFPGYGPDDPKAWTAAHSAGNVLDQFAKLDESLSALQGLLKEAQSGVKVSDVSGALKSIGKYGERLTSGAKSALGVELPMSSLDDSAEFFARLMADEKSGALLASRLTSPEKIMQEMVTAERAVYRVQQASDQLLMELMQRANLAGVKGDFKTIQAATQNQLLFREISTGVVEHIHALGVRALNALGQGQPRQ